MMNLVYNLYTPTPSYSIYSILTKKSISQIDFDEILSEIEQKKMDVNQQIFGAPLSINLIEKQEFGLESLKKLVEYNADLSLCDEKGVSPLMTAAERGKEEIVSFILETTATETKNLKDEEGDNAFFHALKNKENAEKICTMLCKSGIDINAQNKKLNTPLLFSISQNKFSTNDEISKTLIELNADLSIANAQEETALSLAKRYEKCDLADFITKHMWYKKDKKSEEDFVVISDENDLMQTKIFPCTKKSMQKISYSKYPQSMKKFIPKLIYSYFSLSSPKNITYYDLNIQDISPQQDCFYGEMQTNEIFNEESDDVVML